MIVYQTTMLAGGMLILLSLQSKTVEAATKYVFDISNSLEEVERSFMAISGAGKEEDYDSYEPPAMDPPDKAHDSPPLHNPTVLQQVMGLAPRHPTVDVPGRTATATTNNNKNLDERNTAEHIKYTKERNRKRYAVSSSKKICHFKICPLGKRSGSR